MLKIAEEKFINRIGALWAHFYPEVPIFGMVTVLQINMPIFTYYGQALFEPRKMFQLYPVVRGKQ